MDINENKDKLSIDKQVAFNEEKHIYYLTKDPSFRFTSCTTVIKEFHEPFNSDAVSDKLASGQGLSGASKAKKKEELKKEWANSAVIGTYVHKLLEDLANNEVSNANFKYYYPQMTAVIKFYADYIASGKYEVISTEDILYSIDLAISGQRDIKLREVSTGRVINGDLKTSKVIDKKGFRGKKMLGAFKQLDDCRYNKYSVQLAIYNYLDTEKADENWIIHVHTDGNYYIHKALPIEIDFKNPSNFRSIYIKNEDVVFGQILSNLEEDKKKDEIKKKEKAQEDSMFDMLGYIDSIQEKELPEDIVKELSDEDIFMEILKGIDETEKDDLY